MQPLRIPAFRLISTSLIFTLLLALAARGFADSAVEVAKDPGFPHLRQQGAAAQLIVDGQPLVMLAGELHNSSSSSLDYLRPIWPRLTSLNLNTVVASLSWELVEPEEGKYDFALLDGIISAARANDMKLVLIWFATWKNADSTYVPAWVKTNWKRFPRCQHRPGQNSTQLSALSEEAMKADARAYAAVMKHIREADAKRHTVVMMQVENEAGVRPVSRDHSPAAEAAFAQLSGCVLEGAHAGEDDPVTPADLFGVACDLGVFSDIFE
jgi:beta-galactosidase GanA